MNKSCLGFGFGHFDPLESAEVRGLRDLEGHRLFHYKLHKKTLIISYFSTFFTNLHSTKSAPTPSAKFPEISISATEKNCHFDNQGTPRSSYRSSQHRSAHMQKSWHFDPSKMPKCLFELVWWFWPNLGFQTGLFQIWIFLNRKFLLTSIVPNPKTWGPNYEHSLSVI